MKKRKIKSEVLFFLRLNVCETCEFTSSTQSWKITFVEIITDTIYLYLVGKTFGTHVESWQMP